MCLWAEQATGSGRAESRTYKPRQCEVIGHAAVIPRWQRQNGRSVAFGRLVTVISSRGKAGPRELQTVLNIRCR